MILSETQIAGIKILNDQMMSSHEGNSDVDLLIESHEELRRQLMFKPSPVVHHDECQHKLALAIEAMAHAVENMYIEDTKSEKSHGKLMDALDAIRGGE